MKPKWLTLILALGLLGFGLGCDDGGGGDDDTEDDGEGCYYDSDGYSEIWSTQTVDSDGDVGLYSSIAVDSDDNVYIGYYKYVDDENSELKYATNVSGVWQTFTVDSSEKLGSYPSIAIDSNDRVHISYYNCGKPGYAFDCDKLDLKYATNRTGEWQALTVDYDDWSGFGTSIAVDSGDNVHISHCSFRWADLLYSTNSSGQWETSTVVEGYRYETASYDSIALDSSDNVHISYYSCELENYDYWYFRCLTADLKYATKIKGAWRVLTVDAAGDVGRYSSIAVDSKDAVHISYYQDPDALKYATNASRIWSTSYVDTSDGFPGIYTSIATDSNDMVHISYHNCFDSSCSSAELKYATNVPGYWATYVLDFLEGVGITSITVDSKCYVHISYYDPASQDLKYVTNRPPE